ncbi:hypothetical protein NA56DRAFT_702724 [Hyaloscypha hepaticicola]|uniref:BTB domain-containing protein n=1 Tax=Hyaloscypha hepaticicola TaxID=2082293 RepID=A0A2J6Q802_9HELO|nr:hypothetical protein NA56DRAFT_702724 [Hyaloscypha hepaticicola]
MFKRSIRSTDRVDKVVKLKKSYRDPAKLSKLQKSFDQSPPVGRYVAGACLPSQTRLMAADGYVRSTLTSPIVTFTVGKEGRLFAAHEDVLSLSPFFAAACRGQFLEAESKRIDLPDEEPEIFSCVLEYLYKGDYYPRLMHNKRKNSWDLEDAVSSPNPENPGGRGSVEATIYISSVGQHLLRDTVIYCAGEKYGLEELKRLALRKQGLQSGIEVSTILRSARYAYDNTPDTDSRLRAHYLALIIRCRKTFKRSGTMQTEMESGGKLFFDLFVALCNHVDDIVEMGNSKSPKTI